MFASGGGEGLGGYQKESRCFPGIARATRKHGMLPSRVYALFEFDTVRHDALSIAMAILNRRLVRADAGQVCPILNSRLGSCS
jgi:hypothetical protein